MFEFIDNQTIRIIVEVGAFILTTVLGFFGGCTYTNIKIKKANSIGNIKESNIGLISQQNK